MSEEARFRSAVEKSWEAAWAVARYLHAKGERFVQVAPLSIRPTFKERSAYGDDADVLVRMSNNERWSHIEVKWRNLSFTGAKDYPYPTIFIDRSSKVDKANADAYYIVSQDLRYAALITKASRARWLNPKIYFDRVKKYHFTAYECPVDVAQFVSLQ